MTPTAWVALALAMGFAAPPPAWPARAVRLVGVGRLARGADLDRRATAHPPRVVAGCLAGAVPLAALVLGGALLAIAAAAGAGVGWLVCRDAARGRAAAAERAELGAAVRALIGELEAGAQPPAVLRAAAAVAPRHASVFGEAAVVAARAGDAGGVLAADPRTRAIGLAWRLGTDCGVALADVLATVAADLRVEEDHRRAVESALSGPRASAVLLSGLPLVGIALGVAMGARPLAVLTESTAGRALCCAGVLLDAAGVLWIRRILRRAARL